MIPDCYARRYQALSNMLSGVNLIPKQQKPENSIGDFFPNAKPHAFCHRWNATEIADTFAQTGCLAHWQKQGFTQIWIELENDIDPERHTLHVWTNLDDRSELLMQLVVWLEYLNIERINASYPAFCVEHLRLQTPNATFIHPKLPGQDFAPSGILRRIFGILKSWAATLGAEIITEIPEYFHTAAIFSPYFTFIDTEMEALFRAIRRDLIPQITPQTLAQISHAFEQNRIRQNDTPILWPTEMQAYPLSHDLAQKLHIPPQIIAQDRFSLIL